MGATGRLPENIRALGFDLDGTLLDNLAQLLKAWKLAIERLGLPPKGDEEILREFGRRTTDIALTFAGEAGKASELVRLKDEIYDRLWPKYSRLYPGVAEVLAEVKRRGFLSGVASSNRAERIKRILNHFGIAKYIDAVVGYDEVERGKPHPDMLLKLAEKLGVKPPQLAYVGDSIYDVEAAKRAGTLAVLIPLNPLYQIQRDKSKVEADFKLESIRQLLKLLPEKG
ncbi:MAG: HAD family hydrolase [Candidatus Hecatellaceae archaeon]